MTTLTANPPVADVSGPGRPRRRSLRRLEIRWGLFFISPWIIGFLLFSIFPMAASLYLSFTDYSLAVATRSPTWIGARNYEQMLSLEFKTFADGQSPQDSLSRGYGYLGTIPGTQTAIGATDPNFWKTMRVTLTFAAISLPLGLGFALFLAVLTNMKTPLVYIYRTIFYIPTMVPAVCAAIILRDVLNRDAGWLNGVLGLVGIQGPDWLNNESWVLMGLTLIGLWGVGNAMLIFLAGLQGVPTELYEAAKVDGATSWVRFRRITLPMISPVILYNLVIGLIGSFQYFTVPYILTISSGGTGNPNGSQYFYNMYLYNRAFAFSDMGYASAMAWMLLVVVLFITAVVFTWSGNWVFYAGAQKS